MPNGAIAHDGNREVRAHDYAGAPWFESARLPAAMGASAGRNSASATRMLPSSDVSGAASKLPKATFAELAALGDDVRAEIIHGVIVRKSAPTMEHGRAQRSLGGVLGRRFDRGGGGRWPGGWWLATEVDVRYDAHEICRHDLVGWRRERVPTCPTGRPVDERPDWVCEILSPSNYKRDLVDKMSILRAAAVPHYWILNVVEQILIVHRLEPAGYLVAVTAGVGDVVRAEPFDAVELPLAVLFGADDEE